MNFKYEFLTALGADWDYDSQIKLVRRHVTRGLPIDAAYQELEQIWVEHGYDNTEGGTTQDNLEAVMEKVWYGQLVV